MESDGDKVAIDMIMSQCEEAPGTLLTVGALLKVETEGCRFQLYRERDAGLHGTP